MKWALLGLVGILGLGCDKQEATVVETDNGASPAQILASEECPNPFTSPPNPKCFDLLPASRWHGLWQQGWEWSNFCPEPAKECLIRADHGDIWMEFAEGVDPDLADGLYEVEFIGRRTRKPGNFGHLNQYDHLMIVERMISSRKLPDTVKS